MLGMSCNLFVNNIASETLYVYINLVWIACIIY